MVSVRSTTAGDGGGGGGGSPSGAMPNCSSWWLRRDETMNEPGARGSSTNPWKSP